MPPPRAAVQFTGEKAGGVVALRKKNFFFARIGRSDLTRKLEKVGPFECDELEKHCRVGAKCENVLAIFDEKMRLENGAKECIV